MHGRGIAQNFLKKKGKGSKKLQFSSFETLFSLQEKVPNFFTQKCVGGDSSAFWLGEKLTKLGLTWGLGRIAFCSLGGGKESPPPPRCSNLVTIYVMEKSLRSPQVVGGEGDV